MSQRQIYWEVSGFSYYERALCSLTLWEEELRVCGRVECIWG